MGMEAWAAAKTAFMVDMYCEGSESETETTRMWEERPGAAVVMGLAVSEEREAV